MSSYSQQYVNAIRNKLESLGLVTKNSWTYQEYTLRHKIAFIDVLKILNEYVTDTALSHDTEKLVLYGVMNKDKASKIHRKISKHHVPNCDSDEDRINCIIDYECARFTKKDKPLNAYSTIMKYCPEQYNNLKDYLQKFGIDSADTSNLREIAVKHNINVLRIGEFIDTQLFSKLLGKTIQDIDDVYALYIKFGAQKALEIWNNSMD